MKTIIKNNNSNLTKLFYSQPPLYKTIIWKLEKIYNFFRYKIIHFIKNIWNLRKELWQFRNWDSSFNILLFAKSLELTANNIEKYGFEEDISRLNKVKNMKRVIEILRWHAEDEFMEIAEKELQLNWDCNLILKPCEDKDDYIEIVDLTSKEQLDINKKITKYSDELRETTWNEVWDILKGDYKTNLGILSWWD